MAYKRKTKDIWCIDTNYGDGWETEVTYDNRKEARDDLDEYRLHVSNYGGMCRLVKRREKIV